MAGRDSNRDESVRKVIAFDAETWTAVRLLARDSMKDLQELADEAFRDLLRKHNRPVTLRDALTASTRALAANDGEVVPPRKRKR
jgi:hypothetical protein